MPICGKSPAAGQWKISLAQLLAQLAHLVNGFKEAVDISSAQGTIIKSVSGTSGLAPDHPSVIRSYIALESIVIECLCDGKHIQGAAGG